MWRALKKHTGLGLALLVVLATNLRAFSRNSSITWDARDEMWFFFRWMGACLREGTFCTWMPNILSGYPFAANVQLGAYNPLYLLFAWAFPDSALSINLLHLMLLMLLASVFYFIGLRLLKDSLVAGVFALMLLASGFVIGHASHFSYLSSVLALALCYWGLLELERARVLRASMLVLMGVFHGATAGYPAILVFGAQVLGVAFAVSLWRRRFRLRSLAPLVVSAALGLVLALPALLHFLNQLKLSPRGAGLSVEQVLAGSLPATSFWNFLWPFLGMGPEMPGAVDFTMDRFHLLATTPVLVLAGLWFGRRSRVAWTLLALAVAFWVLALGKNFPLPVRAWMAELSGLYRFGRFPSGEHRFFALFTFALLAGFGLKALLKRSRSRLWVQRLLVGLIVLDFVAVSGVLVGRRYMRLPENLRGDLARFQVHYGPADQAKIDRARGCPFNGAWEFDQRMTPPDLFSWWGIPNFLNVSYAGGLQEMKWALCGPSRLWDFEARVPQAYTLEEYSPHTLRFRVNVDKALVLLWADTTDGLWALRVNGEAHEFYSVPASLRGIRLPAAGSYLVEMKYRGAL
jgi:hypothetical protein